MGKGTTFRVLLPASGLLDDLASHDNHADGWQRSDTVLLTDDEETVRGIGIEMLKLLGFTPITANSRLDAINIFKGSPDIAFVILDVTVPCMDGEQCLQNCVSWIPRLRLSCPAATTNRK